MLEQLEFSKTVHGQNLQRLFNVLHKYTLASFWLHCSVELNLSVGLFYLAGDALVRRWVEAK